jgi:hypothetical protein
MNELALECIINNDQTATWIAVISTTIASFALLFNGLATKGVSKRNDIDTLLRIINDLNDYEIKIRGLAHDHQDREFYISKFINYLEILSGLYNSSRFEKVTKEEVRGILIHDIAFISICLIEFEEQLQNRTNEDTFLEIATFYQKYRSEIDSHMGRYAELGLLVRKQKTENNT